MKISFKTEYALQAVFDLSTQPPEEPIKIGDIAQRQKIPQKFLEVILGGLKQGGFVESRRGAEGGYRLAKASDQITVGEVLRFIEERRTGGRNESAAFADLWSRVDAAVSAIVDRTTFAELARRWKESQTRYVPNWDI